MANVDLIPRENAHREAYSGTRQPYYTYNVIDFADANTAKGTNIAQGDTLEAIYLPAGSIVLAAGVYVEEAVGGTVSVSTVDLGITGGDVDAFVDGFNLYAATAGAYSALPAVSATGPVSVGATSDTLDLLLATQTGNITSGRVVVWAILQDITPPVAPGTAALKS